MSRAFTIVFMLLSPGLLAAQPQSAPGLFDVIPREAASALVVRSIHDVETRANQLLKDVEFNSPITPAQLIGMLYQALGIKDGIDEKTPAALVLLKGDNDDGPAPENLVLILPIRDRDKLLEGYGLKPKAIKDGMVAETSVNGFLSPRFLITYGNHLYLAQTENAIKRISGAKFTGCTAAEQQQFADADVFVLLSRQHRALLLGDYAGQLGTYFERRKDGEERRVGKLFAEGLGAGQHTLIGLRYDAGARVRFQMAFDPKKDAAAREFLELLRARDLQANARNLPEGRSFAVLTWAGDGSKSGIVTKLIFDVFLEGPLPGVFNNLPVFASTDYPLVAGVMHDLWERLKGARVGLYHNEEEKRFGLFGAVAVLDANDGPAFLKEIRTLAKLGNLKAGDLQTPEVKELINIEQLVKDLDAPTYRVRETAATRLQLLGELALPALKKVIDNPGTLEQRQRAERLHQRIDEVAQVRRKELLLPANAPRAFQPAFTFTPAVEKRQGVDVGVLAITLEKQDAYRKLAEQFLGPSWDKVRIAVVGQQLVVQFGSDVALFDETLANVKAARDGLASGKLLASYERQAEKQRTLEMHGSAQGFLGLLSEQWKLPAKLFRTPPELSSFAASIDSDRLTLDIWLPARELRVMVHAMLPKQ